MSGKGKEKTPEKQVAVVEDQVPAHIAKRMAQGSGLKADSEDFVVPRLKLLHGTSKEPKDFNNAKAGEYWVTVLDRPLGPVVDFVPLLNNKRALLMRPLDDKTGDPILARSDDMKHWDRTGKWPVKLKGRKTPDVIWEITDTDVNKDGLLEFGSSDPKDPDSNPAATVFRDYLVYLPAFPELGVVLLSFARTAAKRAKTFNSKIEARGGPMYTQLYSLRVTSENKDGQEYYNMEVVSNGFPSEADTDRAEALSIKYADVKYKSGDEQEQAEGESGGGHKKTETVKDRGDV